MENLYTPNKIRTFSGIYIDPFDPKSEDIEIIDIAHALSQMPRFGGHLPGFYSVAQHSINVCNLLTKKYKLAGLLHDAAEAYILDIPRPIKCRLRDYKKLENGLMKVISDKFHFKYPISKPVKKADEIQLQWEWNTLMVTGGVRINFENCFYYEKWFLSIFHEYSK
jgi:uncharacterized protein